MNVEYMCFTLLFHCNKQQGQPYLIKTNVDWPSVGLYSKILHTQDPDNKIL